MRSFITLPKIKSRKMKWARHVVRMGDIKNAYKMIGKSERKRPLGRPGSR
jgi:hypothetical protein